MFYDPMLEVAGAIAEEFGISISDVLSMLASTGREPEQVRQALEWASSGAEALAAQAHGRPFDLVALARKRLREGLGGSDSGSPRSST